MAAADIEELSRLTVGDAVNYVLFENPFSKVFVKALSGEGKPDISRPVVTHREIDSHWSCPGLLTQILGPSGNWSRLAGFSGLLAVGFGIYGGYAFPRTQELIQDKKNAYDTAARHHLFHSVALLSVPLCNRPMLTGHLMALGIALFCGSSYVYALKDSELARKIAPYGGILLLLAWASMML